MAMTLGRREFLRRTGWIAAGSTLLVTSGCSLLPALPTRNDSTEGEVLSWLQLTPEGRFRLMDPRAELGQDAGTGLLQVAADALGVSCDQVDLVRPSTAQIAPVRSTVGSESILLFAPLMARAGAAMAESLKVRAAIRLSTRVEQMQIDDEGVVAPGGARVAFAELAPQEPELLLAGRLPAGVELTPGRSVGRDLPARDLDTILEAGALYASDVRLPGMLHGRVLRPPLDGAVAVHVDDSSARALPACLGVVRDEGLLVLLAERSGALDAAAQATAMEWEGGTPLDPETMRRDMDVDARLAAGDLEHVLISGSVDEDAPWTADLSLSIPFAAHAFLEPRVAVARWQGDALEVFTGTQDAFYVRTHLAKSLGIGEEQITVHPHRTGGAFGGRTLCTVELEAARAARLAGRPVRIQWTRADEFRFGFHRPPSEHRLRARLDEQGRIADWWHAFTSGHVLFTSAAMPSWMQTATSLVPDPGVARGAAPPYVAHRARVEFTDVRLPVPTGPWRGLGAAPNGCAVEMLVDALAKAAGRDPLQFRIDQLDPEQPRLRHCLERLAELTQAGDHDPAATGFAAAVYKDASYVAVAAQVSRGSSGPRVDRLWCVHDCGLVINPDRVRAQIEGNLTWAIGTTLFEALHFDAAGPVERQFDRYRLAHFSDVPAFEIELVDSGAAPSGAAESAIAAAPAAIINAFTRLDGKAPRRLPLS